MNRMDLTKITFGGYLENIKEIMGGGCQVLGFIANVFRSMAWGCCSSEPYLTMML